MSNIVLQSVTSLILAYIWFNHYDMATKLRSICYATMYSIIEYSWYATTTLQPDGSLKFTPFAKTCRKGFTTWAQWFCNVLYTPIMIDIYFHFFEFSLLGYLLGFTLFPFNIWIAEFIMGYYLLLVWNTRAWEYDGNDAYFHGNIKIGHAKLWLLLFIGIVLSRPFIVSMCDVMTMRLSI
jgi:hypothetical protein